ncbi:Hypothetical protein EIN_306930, partial [Entamoeba invadens IP1]
MEFTLFFNGFSSGNLWKFIFLILNFLFLNIIYNKPNKINMFRQVW